MPERCDIFGFYTDKGVAFMTAECTVSLIDRAQADA